MLLPSSRARTRSVRALVAAAVGALPFLVTPASAAPTRPVTATLDLAQTGTCTSLGGTSDVRRRLLAGPAASTPCPQPAESASLREDEEYRLAARLPGRLARDRRIVLTVAFRSTAGGSSTVGYVDAQVIVSVDGVRVVSLPVRAVLTSGRSDAIRRNLAVPARLVGRQVRSATVTVHWISGTTPSVEPAFGGVSRLALPLDLRRTAPVALHGRAIWKHVHEVDCPPHSPVPSTCVAAVGRGHATPLASITEQRWLLFTISSAQICTRSPTHGTVTTSTGSFDFRGTGRFCRATGGGTRWVYRVRITSGTGRYLFARGRARISGSSKPGHPTVDVWSGRLLTS